MKIRCKNCYRILNQNEEYCTSCGEYSDKMHKAMVTGNYGPDPVGKFKMAFGVFGIAGFIICGILQVVFSVIETKETGAYTTLYSQTNSLFFSSLSALAFCIILFRKDLKDFVQTISIKRILAASAVAALVIAVVILLSYLFKFTQVLPSFTVDYLQNKNTVFFDLKGTCVFKIIIGTIFSAITLEIVRKFLIDAFDETLLGDKAIFIFTSIIMTVFELFWIMAIDIVVVALIINLATTAIYMQTNRNVLINIAMRVVLYLVTILLLIL